jgi:AcrR family transcriptional regulator
MGRQRKADVLPRHRHGLSRDDVQATQQRRILRATTEAVAAEGYRATTVADIVRRAGVSTKTFYEFYADKEAALCAVYDVVDATIERTYASEAILGTGDRRSRMHAAVAFVLGRMADNQASTRVLVIEAIGAGPRVMARRNRVFRRAAALIVEMLGAGGAPFDESLVVAYLGGLTELVVQHVAEHPVRTLLDLLEPACRFTDALFFRGAKEPRNETAGA